MNDTDTTRPRYFDRGSGGGRYLTPPMIKMMPRTPSFRPKRRGVEKSHAPWCMAAGQEISQLRVSRAPGLPMPPGSSARDDQWTCILPSENRYGKKGCEEMICMSSRSFFVGKIPWGCEMMAHPGSFLPIPSHSCLWGINFCKNKVLDRKKAFSYNKEKG